MDDKTKDMLKEAYQYGYAHAIEEVVKHFKHALDHRVIDNPDFDEAYKTVFISMMEMLTEFAQDTKAKELTDY